MAMENVGGLIDTVRVGAQARRREAAEQLRTLLLRNENPKRGDAEQLAAAMVILGLRAEDLPELLTTAQRLARYEGLVGEWGAVAVAQGDVAKRLATVDAWVAGEHARVDAEAKAKREPLQSELAQNQHHRAEIAEARRWLTTLQARWLALGEGITQEEAFERVRASGGMPDGAAAGTSGVIVGLDESAVALSE